MPPILARWEQSIFCLILLGFLIIVGLSFGIQFSIFALFFLSVFSELNKYDLIWSLLGYFSLRIDPDSCQLYWRFYSLDHVVHRRTNKLIEVRIGKEAADRTSDPICAFFSDYLPSPVILGTWLKQHEKDFIVAEVNDFLDNLRQHPS